MQTLASLLVTVAAACAIARPSVPTGVPAPTSLQASGLLLHETRPLTAQTPDGPLLARSNVDPILGREQERPLLGREQERPLLREQERPLLGREQERPLLAPERLRPLLALEQEGGPLLAREEVRPLMAPAPLHILLRRYLGYNENSRAALPIPENYWLNKEINRISQMKDEDDSLNTYNVNMARWLPQGPYLPNILNDPMIQDSIDYGAREPIRNNFRDSNMAITPTLAALPKLYKVQQEDKNFFQQPRLPIKKDNDKIFALTPLDKGYYETDVNMKDSPITMVENVGHHEGGKPQASLVLEPQRQTRQNPNLSKQKHLLGLQIENMNSALEAAREATEGPAPAPAQAPDASADSLYAVAVVAVVAAALTTAVAGFAFGWHALSRKAKAAADVDYPAYGVTGPAADSGDRKLAHSAHMYHYQHQKQQIIAMERNGLEKRSGSITDPESEEENEEGDYTVYECPGFATTGEMEVENPLFSEEPVPAAPGKCEMVKPQPKE